MKSAVRKKFLVPIIKLPEKRTWRPWGAIECDSVIVNAHNLLSGTGLMTNKLFERVKEAGGLHDYIGFDGKVILSSIMPDKTIFGLTPERYAELIKVCKPDFYFTPDAETYLGFTNLSELEIARIEKEFLYILDSCPESIPIGLVKGSNLEQVRSHADFLSSKGVDYFVFHVGDYLCRGTMNSSSTARFFAREISCRGCRFMVYGVGSRKQIRLFSFADEFATQSHYVQAFYGKRLENGRPVKIRHEVTRADIMQNLVDVQKNVEKVEPTGLIFKWLFPIENNSVMPKEKLLLNQKSLIIKRDACVA